MFHIHSITEVLVSQWIKARLEAMYLRQSLATRVSPRKMRKHHGNWRFGFSAGRIYARRAEPEPPVTMMLSQTGVRRHTPLQTSVYNTSCSNL